MNNPEESKRIGERILSLRKEQKLTQAELAEKSGVHRTHVLRIEKGIYDIRLSVLCAIAKALGYKIELKKKR